MAELRNLTPHPVHIVDANGNKIRTIESSGLIRLKATTIPAGVEIDGVKITKTVYGEPEGLPEYNKEVFIVVSQLVKTALPLRMDLLVPAEVLRDGQGVILGCQSLGI